MVPSEAWSELGTANFSERCLAELRKISLPSTPVNSLGYSAPHDQQLRLLGGVRSDDTGRRRAARGGRRRHGGPFDKFDRPRGMVFLVCMGGIWAVAVLSIWLIERAI
jgi:hypothetical protein